MREKREHVHYVRFDGEMLETFVAAGWLSLEAHESSASLSETNQARAHLICDLKRDLGVNDEGVGVILDLIDQIHGLRRALRESLAQSRKPRTQEEY